MARKINKKLKKLIEGKCVFCGCDEYHKLDVHRIIWGQEYSEHNTIVCCVGCHRSIHAGIIVIDRKYNSTSGKVVLHYFENGLEFWK